jgi:hypothetical protein
LPKHSPDSKPEPLGIIQSLVTSTSTTTGIAPAQAPSRLARLRYQLYRTVLGIWKFIAGVALTQNVLGSVAVVGWTYRAVQRAAQKQWWKQGPAEENCFCDFVQCSTYHRSLGGWPNWIVQHDQAWMRAHKVAGVAKTRAMVKALVHSLWLNFKIGFQGIFNTFVLTAPSGALMLFAWYAGWHNSFNKGYEQAPVGPLTGIAGIILFIAALYYLPMAQARQASTGDWRAFYQFKLVWRLIRKKWLACFGLALLYSALSIPVTILKTVPAFFPQINEKLADLPPIQALHFAKLYYFYAAFVVFAAFVALRIVAARIYASGLLACIRSGALTEDVLAENEWETLHRLGLLAPCPAPSRHFLVRTIAWLGTRVGRITTGVALFLVWFTFVAQIYVSEFLLKSPWGRGWINQPLVQLPWFNYIPPALKSAAEGEERAQTPAVIPPEAKPSAGSSR